MRNAVNFARFAFEAMVFLLPKSFLRNFKLFCSLNWHGSQPTFFAKLGHMVNLLLLLKRQGYSERCNLLDWP